MSCEIRWSVAADVDALAEVSRRSSLSNEGDRDLLLAHPEALAFDGGHAQAGLTRVAMVDERVVGYATLLPGDVAELEDLFVDPDWMRRGIGTALVEDAVTLARARNAPRIEVTANHHALHFYEAVGFVAVGTVVTPLGPLASRMHLAVE
ncbi:MAG: GNAT family N-acetyltransferase [Acidimicrobiia bacterium]